MYCLHQIYPLHKMVNYDKEGLLSGPICIDINFSIFEGGNIKPAISTEELLATTEVRKTAIDIEYHSLNIYYTFVQLVCHFYREANDELFIEEDNDIDLKKVCDIYEYLNWAEDKWEIKNLKIIVRDYCLNEQFWFVLYLTDIFYETDFCRDILGDDNYEKKYKMYILHFKKKYCLE